MSRAVVTMYYGVAEPRAEMPTWTKWIVLCFGGWRLLADVLLTLADYFSGMSYIPLHHYMSGIQVILACYGE